MPDYAEAAEKAGWVKVGAKWKHKKHTKEYYNAKDLWDLLPEELKRPLSITAPEPKPVEVKAKSLGIV